MNNLDLLIKRLRGMEKEQQKWPSPMPYIYGESADEIETLRQQRDELVADLHRASNYIDVLGGYSGEYRVTLAKVKGGA